MPGTRLVVGLFRETDNEEYTTVVETDEDLVTADLMVGVVKDAIREARKNVASRFVEHEAFKSDSHYLDTRDSFGENLAVASIRKEGETQRYLMQGAYTNQPEGGQWGDWVHAVDPVDAEFQAKWQMAINEGRDPNGEEHETLEEGLESFIDTMYEINIYDCVEDPVTRQEMENILVNLVAVAKESGLDHEALDKAKEALQKIGREVPEAAPAP